IAKLLSATDSQIRQASGRWGQRNAYGGLDGTSLGTLVQMVGAGIGVTLIPEMAIEVETRSAAVCINRFDAPAPKRSIGLAWRATNPMAQVLKEVADIVRHAAGRGVESESSVQFGKGV
ncbi:LysR substrate-binding domain-containing protein, partial [uncultured Tateyamaria sp.]